jgi:hypothetical protein
MMGENKRTHKVRIIENEKIRLTIKRKKERIFTHTHTRKREKNEDRHPLVENGIQLNTTNMW